MVRFFTPWDCTFWIYSGALERDTPTLENEAVVRLWSESADQYSTAVEFRNVGLTRRADQPIGYRSDKLSPEQLVVIAQHLIEEALVLDSSASDLPGRFCAGGDSAPSSCQMFKDLAILWACSSSIHCADVEHFPSKSILLPFKILPQEVLPSKWSLASVSRSRPSVSRRLLRPTGGIGIATFEAAWQFTVERKGNIYKSFLAFALPSTPARAARASLMVSLSSLVPKAAPSSTSCSDIVEVGSGCSASSISSGWMLRIRGPSLIERTRQLSAIIPQQPSVLLYASHIERNGLLITRFVNFVSPAPDSFFKRQRFLCGGQSRHGDHPGDYGSATNTRLELLKAWSASLGGVYEFDWTDSRHEVTDLSGHVGLELAGGCGGSWFGGAGFGGLRIFTDCA